ncbi:MAG: phosphohistidine phosphatase SixA [Sandaracinus sp.]|nr:phosphohistidine phosphatase SixA [Sandaracinus sp.]
MTLELLIVRHAIAVDREAGWEDADRPLTLKGVARLEKAVAGLTRHGVALDRILVSPWRRAQETAERLAVLLDRGEVVTTEELARAPRKELLRELRSGERVAVVGHEPWLGELCAWLCTGKRELGSHFAMKKAGAATLFGDAAPGGMALTAFLPPKVLRRMAP